MPSPRRRTIKQNALQSLNGNGVTLRDFFDRVIEETGRQASDRWNAHANEHILLAEALHLQAAKLLDEKRSELERGQWTIGVIVTIVSIGISAACSIFGVVFGAVAGVALHYFHG